MPPSSSTQAARALPRRNLVFVWAVGGVVLLLAQSIYRLGLIAWDAINSGLMSPWQQALCALWVVTNCYAEGHRGFHKRFVPRVLARAHHLALHPEPKLVLLAPLYSMAFFRATKRAKGAAWGVTIAVLLAIVVVRSLSQPWRGLIDAGVVAGLTWGTISMLLGASSRLSGNDPAANPELMPLAPPPEAQERIANENESSSLPRANEASGFN